MSEQRIPSLAQFQRIPLRTYRADHSTATQVEVAQALGISERTVRRYWKTEETSEATS